MVLGDATVGAGIDGVEVALADVGVDGVREVFRRRPRRQEEGVGEDVVLTVGPVRGVLDGVGGEVVQQVVDGLVEGGLDAGAAELLGDVADSPETLGL